MQYLLIFLAVVLVVVCMCGFLFLAIRQTVRRFREQLEDRFIRELSVFDSLYEEKARRLERLGEEEALLRSNIFPAGPPLKEGQVTEQATTVSGVEIPVSHTEDPEFYEKYRYVKNTFRFDYQTILNRAAADGRHLEPTQELGRRARAALEMISADTAIKMATLDGADQVGLLKELLSPKTWELASDYLKEKQADEDRFDILEFMAYLQTVGRLYPEQILVYAGEHTELTSRPEFQIIRDPSICEGVRIVCGNQMYDYSL